MQVIKRLTSWRLNVNVVGPDLRIVGHYPHVDSLQMVSPIYTHGCSRTLMKNSKHQHEDEGVYYGCINVAYGRLWTQTRTI